MWKYAASYKKVLKAQWSEKKSPFSFVYPVSSVLMVLSLPVLQGYTVPLSAATCEVFPALYMVRM